MDAKTNLKVTTKKITKKKKANKKSKRKNKIGADRESRLKPSERDTIRKLLVAHFGASCIDKATIKAKDMPDLDTILKQLKKKMDQEIEDQEIAVQQYYEAIDREYRTVGRPKSVFNWKEMEYLCSIGCTLEEIAGFFQANKETIRARIIEEYGINFNEYYDRFTQGIKVSLRRKQIQVALVDGDVAMLKFLGKNMLGQKEKIDFDGEVKVNSWVDLINNLESKANDHDAKSEDNGKT